MRASVTSTRALLSTGPGRSALLQGALRRRGYSLYRRYASEAASQMGPFAERYAREVHSRIRSDRTPAATQRRFAEEVGSESMALDEAGIARAEGRLADYGALRERIGRILDSKFVTMTLPVLNALYDSAAAAGASEGTRQEMVEGHIIAIDLSEPMDRIVDRDEDLEFLGDYRLMNPHILDVARAMISRCGEGALASFESGFAEARAGQAVDERIQANPARATEADMAESYKKYRAVMGTAGRNMAAGSAALGDAFHDGMAHASECVGCGNEVEDSVARGSLKVPSWALFDAIGAGSSAAGLRRTRTREVRYMAQARRALDSLPEGTRNAEFLEFLFLTIDHYALHWHARARKMSAAFDAALEGLA